MVPFYGRVKLCDVGNDNNNSKKKEKSRADDENNAGKTTRVASNVHEAALECTDDERDALTLYLLSAHAGKPSIVFVNAISSLRRLTALLKIMKVNVVGLHAGMQQRARLKALDRFKSASASALIATDVAARGLDIKGVELVVHYQIPRQADAYVHRCGRTGRANNSGVSVALVIPKERSRYLAMLAAMGREKGFRLPAFPVAEETVREATKRVQLAKRLDQIVHKNEKAKADKTWKKRTAAAMDIGLDSDDDDFDDDFDDDEGEYNNNFSDNEDGVEVIDFDNLKKPFKNNESQKKLQKEAEKRNITKREIGLRNQLDELLSKPLGSLRRSNVTSLKFPTREGKGIISINYKTSNSSSALDILTGRTNNSNFITAGAVAGGAGGARKKQKKLKN
jgi:superfamily II DNA/RNA helicase